MFGAIEDSGIVKLTFPMVPIPLMYVQLLASGFSGQYSLPDETSNFAQG